MKKTIVLTESELKGVIAETVKRIISEMTPGRNSQKGYFSQNIDVPCSEIVFSDNNLDQYVDENYKLLPNGGVVKCHIKGEYVPPFPGNYDNPPSDYELNLEDMDVDIDDAFETFFNENGMTEMFNGFMTDIFDYLEDNVDELVDDNVITSYEDLYSDR